MDLNNFGKNVKQELRAELTPKKVLKAAFIPQTKGLITPLKDIFGIFVTIIGQLFVQAKLLPATHPGMTKEVTGFNAIWMMILDASANLKFRRENLYQIIIFYGIVGMLIFGVLDFATFLMHFSLGSAHAQGAINNTGSLFNEVDTDNGPSWINYMFPYGNNASSAGGLPGALQGMLLTYNSAILALATVLALHQIVSLFIESAHHGTYGGGRYSHLYAPLRLVMGIGLLIPISNGFNTGQIIALDMAKMGSGLASNVWQSFENSLNSIGNNSAEAPIAAIDETMQKLIVDETCMAAAMDTNGGGTPVTAATSAPTWNVVSKNGLDGFIASYVVHFDAQPGDGFCGSIEIPAQQASTALKSMGYTDYFLDAFTGSPQGTPQGGNSGILGTVWPVAAQIYVNSQGGGSGSSASADPTLNPFTTGSTVPSPTVGTWKDWIGTAGNPVMNTSGNTRSASFDTTGTNILGSIQNASVGSYNDYEANVASSGTTPTTGDWTRAGYLFLQMSHNAGALYQMQNPNIAVALPDTNILPKADGSPSADCPSMFNFFSTTPYACSTAGKTVTGAVFAAIKDIKAATMSAGLTPVAFDPGSIGSGNDGGRLNSALAGPLDSMYAAFKEAMTSSVGWGSNAASVPNQFGQSIFNVMFIGNVILAVIAALFVLSAVVGSSLFGLDAGLEIGGIAAVMLPIGFGLSVMVPMMPAARFVFGLFAWVMTLFEAMVAIPIMALVSIKSSGEGLFAHGEQGWLLLVQMMLRPVLMVFGLIGGVIVFDTLAGFINTTVFGVWFGLFNSGGTGVVSAILGAVGLLYFYLATIYSCANLAFGMINTIPDRILQWIGGQGIQGTDGAAQGALEEGRSNAGRGATAGLQYAQAGMTAIQNKREKDEGKQLAADKANNEMLVDAYSENQKFDQERASQQNNMLTDAYSENQQFDKARAAEQGEATQMNKDFNSARAAEQGEAMQMNNDMNSARAAEQGEAMQMNNDMNSARAAQQGEAMQMNRDMNSARDAQQGEAIQMNNDLNSARAAEQGEAMQMNNDRDQTIRNEANAENLQRDNTSAIKANTKAMNNLFPKDKGPEAPES